MCQKSSIGLFFLLLLVPKTLDMIERVFYNRKALEWVNPVGGPHSFLIFSASLRACNKSGRQPEIGCLPLAIWPARSDGIKTTTMIAWKMRERAMLKRKCAPLVKGEDRYVAVCALVVYSKR